MAHIFAINAPILNCRLVLTLNHKLFRSACVCLCLYVFVCMSLSICLRACVFVCVCVPCACVCACMCAPYAWIRLVVGAADLLVLSCVLSVKSHALCVSLIICVCSVSCPSRRCDAPMWSMLCSPNTRLGLLVYSHFSFECQNFNPGITLNCALWSANT